MGDWVGAGGPAVSAASRKLMPQARAASAVNATRRTFLLVLVGALLLANGWWLYPQGVSYEQEYYAEAEPAHHPAGEFGTGAIQDCVRGVSSKRCALRRHVAADGPVRLDDPGDASVDVTNESEQSPEFVRLDDGYYRLTATITNGSLVLSMEPVLTERVLDVVAVNESEVDPAVRRAIGEVYDGDGSLNGHAETTAELPDRRLLVRSEGELYEVYTGGPVRGDPTGWGWKTPPSDVISTFRLAGWLLGLLAVWYGGYRYAVET